MRSRGFAAGVGIASGVAVAGRLGTAGQFKIDVFGPVVNLASRLEGIYQTATRTLAGRPEHRGAITYSGGERVPQHELLACAQCGCFAFSCFEDFAIRMTAMPLSSVFM